MGGEAFIGPLPAKLRKNEVVVEVDDDRADPLLALGAEEVKEAAMAAVTQLKSKAPPKKKPTASKGPSFPEASREAPAPKRKPPCSEVYTPVPVIVAEGWADRMGAH